MGVHEMRAGMRAVWLTCQALVAGPLARTSRMTKGDSYDGLV